MTPLNGEPRAQAKLEVRGRVDASQPADQCSQPQPRVRESAAFRASLQVRPSAGAKGQSSHPFVDLDPAMMAIHKLKTLLQILL
ncbi:MAG: hypothetical protein ACRD9R_15500 [Pyrinomonadaceae bacterium]